MGRKENSREGKARHRNRREMVKRRKILMRKTLREVDA